MKTVFHCLVGVLAMFALPAQLSAQCGPGLGPFTVKYDTVVYGTGNNSYLFSLPQFNIPLGILLSANVQSVRGLRYSYTARNTDTSAQIYKAKIMRFDEINSTVLDPSSIIASNQMSNITHTILPLQQVSYGPQFRTYKVNDSIVTSDPRLFNFMGTGTVDFTYDVISSAPFQNGIQVTPTVFDTIRFSVSYLYCLTSLLPADKLFFTAAAQSKDNVLLNWRQLSVEPNRIYHVQVSTDGSNFTTVATVNENNTGAYTYTHLHNATSRLYFRILQQNASGEVKYSEIRTIDPNNETVPGVQVFPSLYKGGSLQFNFPARGSWNIHLYSAEGKKVLESRQADASNAQILLPTTVSNGVYTAQVINTQSQQKYFTRIIVQR